MNFFKIKNNASNGFTILEVLVSMIIVALVMTIIYSAFSAGSKVCKFGSKRAQIFHSARLAMQDIIQSIENLEYGTNEYFVFVGKSQSGKSIGGESVGEDELEFATSTEPTFIDGRWHAGLARVKYVIEKDRKDPNATVLEKWVTELDDEDFKDAYVVELSQNIVGVSFRYYDDNDYDDSWDSDTKEKLPELVEVTFYIQEGDNVILFRSGALIPNMIVGKKVEKSNSTPSTESNTPAPSPDNVRKKTQAKSLKRSAPVK